ncbi:MAG: trypsin-like peptidase domain-containing protein [Candidatus Kaiserbacteria bacterium]|nr:trypsin-like peptidase domain-containing protein [Candidatus Kaiserbacteria bacterium]
MCQVTKILAFVFLIALLAALAVSWAANHTYQTSYSVHTVDGTPITSRADVPTKRPYPIPDTLSHTLTPSEYGEIVQSLVTISCTCDGQGGCGGSGFLYDNGDKTVVITARHVYTDFSGKISNQCTVRTKSYAPHVEFPITGFAHTTDTSDLGFIYIDSNGFARGYRYPISSQSLHIDYRTCNPTTPDTVVTFGFPNKILSIKTGVVSANTFDIVTMGNYRYKAYQANIRAVSGQSGGVAILKRDGRPCIVGVTTAGNDYRMSILDIDDSDIRFVSHR